MNNILLTERKHNDKWYLELSTNIIGKCSNLDSAKKLATEYCSYLFRFDDSSTAIKFKYLNTTFIIKKF